MKIGMLVPEFPTQTHAFFWREIEAIREQGIAVEIISTKRPVDQCPHDFAVAAVKQTHYVYPPDKLSILQALLSPKKFIQSLSYIRSLSGGWVQKLKQFGYYLCAIDLLRFSTERGITHIHSHSCADAAHIVAIAHAMGGPSYSLHLHGDLEVYGTDHKQKSSGALFVAAAASPMQQQLIDKVKLPKEATHTLWMGVDSKKFELTRNFTPTPNPFHVVSISRLHLNKGHIYTLQAIRNLVADGINIKYTIAGSGPHEEQIKSDIATLHLNDNVSLVGSLGESEVLKLLLDADVFILSSIGVGEASPVAVMEAMSSGLPCVCSIIGGTPDMIDNGVDGVLVAQKNVSEIENALRRVYTDFEYRKQLGINAIQKAKKQFDSHMTSKKLVDIIALHLESQRSKIAV